MSLKGEVDLKLNIFLRMRANFSVGGKAKTVEVVVFNQQMNPQSSMKAFFKLSWLKDF